MVFSQAIEKSNPNHYVQMTSLQRPPSPNSNYFNYFAVLCTVGTYLYCRHIALSGPQASLLIVGTYAFVVLGLEVLLLRTPMRDSVGLDFSRRDTVPQRIAIKLLGVYGSFGFVALLYWLFPEYHGNYYAAYWHALQIIGPTVVILAIPYTVFMDERMREPYDSYYAFGKCLLMDWKGTKPIIIIQHLLGWVVKGYFLPLMYIGFNGNINYLHHQDFADYFTDFHRFFRLTVDILFTFDLLGAVAGYVFAIRLFDTHLRSAEPTFFGWVICLICYQPFLSVFMRFYLSYPDTDWMHMMDDYPVFQMVWGSFALLLLVCYTLASINFGCRFSNLTHRGVLTKGMYRFSKHPAYVSKNLFWWITFVPFIPVNGWLDSLRFCILVGGISTVYYVRARTEEAHMSRDPVYVQYALYMNEHSIFRSVARYLPFLKYKAPANWETLPKTYMGLK